MPEQEERRLSKTTRASDSTPHGRYILLAACAAVGVILFVVMLFQAEQVVLAIFAGALVACLLEALSSALRRRAPLSNGGALAVVLVVFLLAATGLTWALAPTVVQEVEDLVQRLPEALDDLRSRLRELPGGERLISAAENAAGGDTAIQGAAGQARDAVATTVQFFVYTLVIVFIGIYLAFSPRTYVDGVLRLVPPAKRKEAAELLDEVGTTIRWWLVGRAASLSVVGVLTTIGLWILGVPAALALGILAGVLSVIPNFGPILSVIPAMLMAVSQGGRMVAYVVLLYLGIQFLESYFITPLIQQRAVHLPPALILMTQALMGVLFGFLGLLLATPLVAIALVVVQRLYIERFLGDVRSGGVRSHAA